MPSPPYGFFVRGRLLGGDEIGPRNEMSCQSARVVDAGVLLVSMRI